MIFKKNIFVSVKNRSATIKKNIRERFKRFRSNSVELGSPQAVIWIFGCQRSGTTFLENVFRQDLDSVVFGEFSELTIKGRKTVLTSSNSLIRIVSSKNAKYAVIRPLFESDRAIELMNLFPNSIGIWMFRDCSAVVDSMKRKWGKSFFRISSFVESDANNFWRLKEALTPLTESIDRLPIDELYARYWIMRNSLPFDKEMVDDPRMLFLDYNTLVHDPRYSIETILKATEKIQIWSRFKTDAKTSSTNREIVHYISDSTLRTSNQLLKQLKDLSRRNFIQ